MTRNVPTTVGTFPAWALLFLASCTTAHKSTGPSVLLPKSGCTGTPIGCWSDCLAGQGDTTTRTLPIGVSGCCQEDQDPPGGCPTCPKACVNAQAKKSNPDFVKDVCPSAGHACPSCVGSQLTGQTCADYCAEMNPEFAVAGVEYGVQCFCGMEMHAQSKLNDPAHKCDMVCGGNSAEKCGGGCALTVYEITCESEWGWTFLIALFIGSVLYVTGGVAYSHKALGQPIGIKALPHRNFWITAYGLVVDGGVFFVERAKREIAKQRGETGYQSVPDAAAAGVAASSVTPAESTAEVVANTHEKSENANDMAASDSASPQAVEQPNARQPLNDHSSGSDDSLVE